jgi:hypothetical protein
VLRRVAPVVVCVAVFYAVVVSIRLEQHDVLWFVHIGSQFLSSAHTSDVIKLSIGAQNALGYDGQYYFALAADPQHAHDYMGGNAGVVYARAFYPLVTGVTSGRSVHALPWSMLLVNLLAVLAGTAAVAVWLARRGSSPVFALAYGLYPGLVVTVFRDLTEPLAFALAALAFLAFDRRNRSKLALSAVLFALAILTRETIVPFALAGVATIVLDGRRYRQGLAFLAATCGPLVAWRIAVGAWLGQPTQEIGHERGWILPLHGIWSYRPLDGNHELIVAAVTVPALATGLGALLLLRERKHVVLASLLLVNVLLYVVWLPRDVYVDYSGAARAAIGVVLAALYCVPAWRSAPRARIALAVGTAGLTIAWYLLAAAALGQHGFLNITT